MNKLRGLTIISSDSLALGRQRLQRSIVNKVEELLNTEVSELIRAESKAANMTPRTPGEKRGLSLDITLTASVENKRIGGQGSEMELSHCKQGNSLPVGSILMTSKG